MTHVDEVAEILADWRQASDEGGMPDPEAVIEAHPEHADALRAAFAAVDGLPKAFRALEPAPVAGPAQIGEFRIIREIGRGGMGVVYEAEQDTMQRRVALKVLGMTVMGSPHAVKRFQREARAAGRLHHTNIVPVYAMDQEAGYWYYAMELVEGRSLEQVLADMRASESPDDPVPAEASAAESALTARTGGHAYFAHVAETFAGVADALELAHQEGIIHRDIKPSNLLLASDGMLKIVDFGLARTMADGPSMTMTGDLLGTPKYMSPEQAMAKRMPLDYRTDIYSLGATLYEALTLHAPFDGETLQELCSQIITQDPMTPRRRDPQIPRDLETIALKAIEKDREKRYASAREFAQDLRRFAAGASITAKRIGPAGRAWRKVKRHKVRASLVASMAFLVVVAVLLASWGTHEARRRAVFEYARLCARGEEALAREGAERRQPEPFGDTAPSSAGLFTEAIGFSPDRPEAYLGRSLSPGRTAAQRLDDLESAHEYGLSKRAYHLGRAFVLARDGKVDEAQAHTDRAKESPRETPIDAYFEARMQAVEGRHEDAIALFGEVIESADRDQPLRYLAYKLRAVEYMQRGQWQRALEDLLAVRAAGDRGPRSSIGIAWLWSRQPGQEHQAEAWVERALAEVEEDGSAEAWLDLCRQCWDLNRADWHFHMSGRALAAHRTPEILAQRAGSPYLKGEERLRLIDEAIARDEQPWFHVVRGRLVGEAGYRKAIALDPDMAVAHSYLANSLLHKWRRSRKGLEDDGLKEVWKHLDRALALDPDLHHVHCVRAKTLNWMGKYEEALEASEQALRVTQLCPATHAHRGFAFYKLKKQQAVYDAYTRAIEVGGPDAHHEEARAMAKMRLGELEEAVALFRSSLSIKPRLSARMNLGGALYELKRFEEALEVFDEAAKSNATVARRWRIPDIYVNRALVHQELKNYEKAFEDFKTFLEIRPKSAHGYWCLGELFGELGKLEQAEMNIRTAQRYGLTPDVLNERAWEIARTNGPEYAYAILVARLGVEAAPRSHGMRNTLGTLLVLDGKPKRGVRQLREAVQLGEGGDGLDWIMLAIGLAALGEKDNARAWYDKAAAWFDKLDRPAAHMARWRARAEKLLAE